MKWVKCFRFERKVYLNKAGYYGTILIFVEPPAFSLQVPPFKLIILVGFRANASFICFTGGPSG